MGWFLVNVLLPMVAPLVLIIPFRWFPLPERNARLANWPAPIKDGQLAWAGLAFTAAAVYELINSARAGTSVAHWILGGLLVLLVANGLVATLGGIFPADGEPAVGRSPWRHYPAILPSVGVSLLSALALTVVHFMAAGQGEFP